MTGRFTSSKVVIAVLATAGLALGGASAASADEADPTPADEVFEASPVVGEVSLAPDQEASVQGNVITVDGDGSRSSIVVSLPVSANAELEVERGVVVLSDNESSSIVPVQFDDGSVAIHSVLNDAGAPTTYRYTFVLNEGTKLVLSEESGGVIALNTEGGADFFVAPPWATDANGTSVPTRYSVDGDALIQHIDVDPTTVFPVVADPWAGIDLVSSFTWSGNSPSTYRLNVNPTPWARGFTGNLAWYQAVGEAGWSELYNKVPSQQRSRMTESGKGQYICHMGFAGHDAQWNLEMWKATKSAAGWVSSQCN